METDIQASTSPDASSPEIAEKINKLSPGTYCRHRSWGFGQVREWNQSGQMVIDFTGKKGHLMQFQYAAETLTPLPEDDIQVQKSAHLDELKKRAKEEPLSVIKECIKSLGAQATADEFQKVLSPQVIPADQWKKWWDSAKRAMKKDGKFYIPTKKSEPIRELEAANALGDQAVESFRAAMGSKAILIQLMQVIKHWPEIKNEALADEVRNTVNLTLSKMPKSQLSLALELAIGRDEFLAEAGLPPETGNLSIVSLVPTTQAGLSSLLEELPGLKQGKLLAYLREGMPEEWPTLFLSLLPRANGRVAESVMEAFVTAGRGPEVVTAINRILRERSVTCDFLYWFCKNRYELFIELFEPQLMLAILSVLEKDQLSENKRGTKLYELLLSDKDLVGSILKDVSYEDVRDITRAIILSPVFEELDKRSLLAKIIKLYPDVQAMIVGERSSSSDDAALIVSWESLERRKLELEEVITKKIPENSKEIGIARSYGDLRENHEFKAAKEMQTVLMRRKAELEAMLSRAQGTDFGDVDHMEVNIGTKVKLAEVVGGKEISYTILGAWDSDVSKGIISYLTPVAQALFKHKVGDEVELPTDGQGALKVRIEKIELYKP